MLRRKNARLGLRRKNHARILCVFLVLTAGANAFNDMRALAAEAADVALLALTVNGVNKGSARVLVRGDQILIAVDTLRAAGIRETPTNTETIGGLAYVSAGDLSPRIRAAYDQDNLALSLTVDPTLLAPTTIDLASGAPADLENLSSPSAFINYAVSDTDGHTPSSISEQVARIGNALVSNVFSVTSQGRFIRGNSSINFDSRAKSTRLTIGDSVNSQGLFGGVARIGGISYASDFSINPYFTPYPNQRFAGVVETPSTADVYVNGRLVRSVDVPPGVFNLENLPGVSGAGNIRVVVRNAFGQAQELNAPYYLGTQLLRQGLSDFNYSLGVERDLSLASVGKYDGFAFAGHHRYGLTDRLTVGGFVVGNEHKIALGPETTFSLPLGTVGVFAAGSRQDGVMGSAGAVQYSYQSTTFSAGAAFTYTSAHYATLGLDRTDDRATARIDAFLGVPVGKVSDISFDLSHARYRDAGVTSRASVTGSTRIGRRFNLALTLSRGEFADTPTDYGAFLGFTVALGSRMTATASVDVERRGATEAVQIQQALPYGEGFGYFVQAANGAQAASFADVQYQGRYGLYEVNVVHTDDQTQTTVSAAGSIVAIGGRVLASRPIQDAYALVRTPGVAGVTTTLSHQSVGKTDSRGDILVPNLLSYYGNELGIDDQDIPLNYSIAKTDRTVAPPYRGGAVVAFPVKRLQAYVGTLEVQQQDKAVVPAYGDLTVGDATSPINGKGEFYLETMPAGTNPAVVRYEGGVCNFTITTPQSTERFVQMGKLTCVEQP